MSLLEPTLFSLARAAAVSLATLLLLLLAGPGIRSASPAWRAPFFWLAMLALLAPGFVSGFVHYAKAMSFTPLRREIFYGMLVWVRFFWLAILAVWLMPPSLSTQAIHCFRQGTGASWWRRKRWELRGWGRGLWLGTALVFLLTFQEFELATTWSMRSWTVALFDAQTGGLLLGESLRMALLPLGIQAALWCWFIVWVRPAPPIYEGEERIEVRSGVIVTMVILGASVQYGTVFYTVVMAPLSMANHGGDVLLLVPWREMANGAGLAAAATLVAWLLAGWIERRKGWRWLLILPGLFGPLLCSLLLLAILRLPLLDGLRDTVFAPVAGLAWWLSPFALLLRLGHEATRDRAALYTARESGSRWAMWRLLGWPRLVSVLLLFGLGYGDFTVNSLLAPPQFTSVSVRLLNLLHYGRNSALAVMFALAFALPVVAALLTVLGARFYARRRAH